MRRVRPTLFEEAGGPAGIRRLTEAFYERVFADPTLAVLFRDPGDDHAERLALWLTELLGGPPEHSRTRGGFDVMTAAHHGLRISEAQRQAWVAHMFAACEEIGLSASFRQRFLPHVEGGSTYATRVSWPADQRWPR